MKKLICLVISIVVICTTLSGCIISDYYRYFNVDLDALTEYFHESQSDFFKVASLFQSNPDLKRITTDKSWAEENNAIKYKSFVLIAKHKLTEEECQTIDEQVTNLFKQRNLLTIYWYNQNLVFVYTSIFSGSNGWIYTPDGVEPDKEKNYIAEMERINENWYSCIWAS